MLFILTFLLTLVSCMDDDELWIDKFQPGNKTTGLFILNQGNFMYENASVFFYDTESHEVFEDVFYRTNGLPLGDVAHSMTIRDSIAWIVVNNSGKIYLMDTRNFEYKGKITGLTSPRFIHFISDTKAYVSDLYSKAITIVDPVELKITGNIPVPNNESGFYQHPTEQMIQYGKYIFTNCWSFDNKILVIDTETDKLMDSVEVGKQPVAMVMDKHNKIWTLTDGGYEGSPYGHEAPALYRIDPDKLTAEKMYEFEVGDYPKSLRINSGGDTLWFINRHVYHYAIDTDPLPGLFIESPYQNSYSGGFNALGIDPDGTGIYVGDAIDFVQHGLVYRYLPSGIPVDTFRTGIIPANFCFR